MKRLTVFFMVFAMFFTILGSSKVAISGKMGDRHEKRVEDSRVSSWDIPGSFAISTDEKEKSTPLQAVMNPEDYYGP